MLLQQTRYRDWFDSSKTQKSRGNMSRFFGQAFIQIEFRLSTLALFVWWVLCAGYQPWRYSGIPQRPLLLEFVVLLWHAAARLAPAVPFTGFLAGLLVCLVIFLSGWVIRGILGSKSNFQGFGHMEVGLIRLVPISATRNNTVRSSASQPLRARIFKHFKRVSTDRRINRLLKAWPVLGGIGFLAIAIPTMLKKSAPMNGHLGGVNVSESALDGQIAARQENVGQTGLGNPQSATPEIPGGFTLDRLKDVGSCQVDSLPDRPPNGFEPDYRPASGHGQLAIKNGDEYDAAVILAREDQGAPDRLMYVRRGMTAEMRSISPGVYNILFQSGTAWDKSTESFKCTEATQIFDRAEIFTERNYEDGVNYSRLSLTLYKVLDGNAPISNVPNEQFRRRRVSP